MSWKLTKHFNRDSEDSAPAEYPPDQPEADTLEDDADAYGAEEAEMQAALEKELAETEAAAAAAKDGATGEDHDMEGTEEAAAKVKDDEEDDVSDAGSEDLEAESSGSEDEEEEEGDGEGEDMEMETDEKPANAAHGEQKPVQSAEVMVH